MPTFYGLTVSVVRNGNRRRYPIGRCLRSTSTILDRFSPGAMAPYSFIIREYGAKPLGAADAVPFPVDISVFSLYTILQEM